MSEEKQDSEGYLATGPKMWWSRSRPRLAVSSPKGEAAPRTKKTYRIWSTVKAILGVIVVLAVALGAFWLVLGVTIIPTVRADGDTWVVQRAAWPEGKAPSGATVLALGAPVERGIVERAELLVSSGEGNYVAKIIAAPGSEISTDSFGTILVDGVPSEFRVPPEVPLGSTGEDYLAVCLSDTCGIPGYPIAIPTDVVLGKVLGVVESGGFGPFPTFTGITE